MLLLPSLLGARRKPMCRRPLAHRIPGEQEAQPTVMELLAQEATASLCKITVYSSQIN